MKITVTTIAGSTFQMEVNESDTIEIVKQKILATKRVPPMGTQFFNIAVQIDEEPMKIMKDYCVHDGTCIHMVINI